MFIKTDNIQWRWLFMSRRPISRNTSDPEGLFVDYMLNDLPKYVASKINCINLGKIIHNDTKRHECNIQLLPLTMDEQKVAVVSRAIVPASIYKQDELNSKLAKANKLKYEPMLKVGSVVTVGFFDREIDNFQHGKNYKIESDRMHSLNDPIVLGVIE